MAHICWNCGTEILSGFAMTWDKMRGWRHDLVENCQASVVTDRVRRQYGPRLVHGYDAMGTADITTDRWERGIEGLVPVIPRPEPEEIKLEYVGQKPTFEELVRADTPSNRRFAADMAKHDAFVAGWRERDEENLAWVTGIQGKCADVIITDDLIRNWESVRENVADAMRRAIDREIMGMKAGYGKRR